MSNDTNEDSLFCDSESENHFIDEATAQNFLSADNGDLICEATGISDEAAKIISNYRGSLYLNGLTELSDAAAEALSKHQGTICEMEPEEWVASVGKNELIQKGFPHAFVVAFLDGERISIEKAINLAEKN